MVVSKKILQINSEDSNRIKNLIFNNEKLNIIENSDVNISVYPKYKSSFPFSGKRKSSLNYYYELKFLTDKIEISYVLLDRVIYTLILTFGLMFLFLILIFFYPKMIGILIISFVVLIITLITSFISFFKAKDFLKNEILSI